MKNIRELLVEPTDKPVERSKQVNWFHITLIKAGIFISLPGLVTGVKVGSAVGFTDSVLAFFCGGLILGLLASFTGTVGAKSKLTTYMIVQNAFGIKGALLINLVFGLSLFGWFGINTALFGSAVLNSLGDTGVMSKEVYSIIGAALMIGTAVFGFKALDKLSLIAVPILFFGLFLVVYVTVSKLGVEAIIRPNPEQMDLGKAISAVVGGSVVGTVIFPDVCRYALSYKHGVIAAIVSFALLKPIVMLCSAIPSLASGQKDIIAILDVLNLGFLGLVFVVFTTWTSNNGNLYAASLSLSTVFKQYCYWQLVMVSGVLGAIFAVSGAMNQIIPFLHLMGICIPPVAGVYVANFFLEGASSNGQDCRKPEVGLKISAMVSWILAIFVAFCTLNDVFIFTTIPALDSLLTSGLVYFILDKYEIIERVERQIKTHI